MANAYVRKTSNVPVKDFFVSLICLHGAAISAQPAPRKETNQQAVLDLENEGANTEVAVNGQEAVKIFNHDKHQLILMDLHMPVMDGYNAARLLREKGEAIPVLH